MSSFLDWSTLPPDLLQTIASALQTVTNYIRFRSVCRSWRAAAQLHRRYLPQEFPLLMLPVRGYSSDKRWFYNPLTETLRQLSMPEAFQNHRCAGSSSGRLVLMDGYPDIVVVNPLTGVITYLPPLTSFRDVANFDPCRVGKEYMMSQSPEEYYSLHFMRECFLKKVILVQSSEDPNQFYAFAISSMGFNLAYCKHGDQWWTSVDETWGYHEDVAYFRGKLYLVNNQGSLAVCDVSNHCSPVVEFMSPQKKKHAFKHYLMDAMGELVLFSRSLMGKGGWGYGKYYTHKFDWNAQEWIPITSLDDTVFCLERDNAFALVASQYSGCQGNMIYTADYYGEWGMGMLNLNVRDGGEDEKVILSYDSPSIWITPSLC